jgi:folate-dependent phosphoribosylglycinamide formyltransferase PurN
VLVTGNHLRHRWLAGRLAAAPELELRGVISEAKRAATQEASPDQPELVQRHFEARAAAERTFFGDAPTWEALDVAVRELELGGANSAESLAWVEELAPTHLVLFGSSIIRPPLLDRFPCVNLHLGLSPYYRGTATNFWPFVEGEPECVGATIHVATERVDAGGILRQVRPAWEDGDGIHEAGCKTIVAAAEAVPRTVAAFAAGEREPVPQTGEGRLFRGADFGEEPLARALRNLEAGLVPRYLADKDARDAARPIVA